MVDMILFVLWLYHNQEHSNIIIKNIAIHYFMIEQFFIVEFIFIIVV